MTEQIGATAGKIWQVLHENGEMNIATLPKKVGVNPLVVHQALGWLARENKLSYRMEGAKNLVGLTQSAMF